MRTSLRNAIARPYPSAASGISSGPPTATGRHLLTTIPARQAPQPASALAQARSTTSMSANGCQANAQAYSSPPDRMHMREAGEMGLCCRDGD